MAKRRHTRKRHSPVVRVGELVTPERRRQLGGVMSEVVDRDSTGKVYIKRQRAVIECMLDVYFRKYNITEAQYHAGLKFREIYLRVMYNTDGRVLCKPFLMPAVKADPEGKMLAHMDCNRHLDEVYKKLTPPQLQIVRDVCGYDKFIGNKDKKETLFRALDRLVEHWKLS